jgi:hypothetical protein
MWWAWSRAIAGRKAAPRRVGAAYMEMLPPGESRTFHLEIGVMADNHEIHAFENRFLGLDGEMQS